METPNWWKELLVLPEVPDCKKLAQQIQASFSHPRRDVEIKETKYHCHAPPAPLCLLQDHFLLPPIPSSPAGISERDGGRRP